MHFLDLLKYLALVLLLLISSVCDIRVRRIPNAVTLPGLAAGVILRVLSEGTEAAMEILLAEGVLLLLLMPVWLLSKGTGIGAGDIKLLMAVASWLSPDKLLTVMLVSFGVGALWCVLRPEGKGFGERRGGVPLAGFIAAGTMMHMGGLY